jgi:hypothetical protein
VPLGEALRQPSHDQQAIGGRGSRAYPGIATALEGDRIEGPWPNGHRDAPEHLAADRLYLITGGGANRRSPLQHR